MYGGRKTFRPARWQHILAWVLLIGFFAASLATFSLRGVDWVFVTFAGFSLIAVLGVIEVSTSYVALDDERLRMRRTFRGHEIGKHEIKSVSAEKGSPTILLLKDGKKLEVPDMGTQSIANSIRSWLRS